MSKWYHLKAWTDKRPANTARPHEQDYITGTTFDKKKRGLDTVIHLASGLGDAFGRLRVAQPLTLFDSKQLYDKQPLFWDDQETSGSGTTSVHDSNKASTTLGVANLTAGKRVRQTFQRFNYQPGKSLLVILTAQLSLPATGITARVGYFDDNNGVFFEEIGGSINLVNRSKASGSVVDTKAEQADWNIDKMDGTGPSGVIIDPTKTQILFFDMEWLGVGRMRCGFYVDGKAYYVHEFLNTNVLSVVYMSTPNLPVRYEISNDGTGGATDMQHICSTVISEGGQQNTGVLRHNDSGAISNLSAGTVYALIGMRLKTTHLSLNVLLENMSALATSQNDKCHWELRFNPTIAGTFTYADETNSGVQVATGASSNTVTGGTEIDGGYFTDSVPTITTVPNALKLGAAIDGTRDTLVLCARPITNNITVEGSFTWRELS